MRELGTIRKLVITSALLFGILVVGIIGYMSIENYSFQQAFYMTIITLSTVGFSEVRSLSSEGQWFTSFLIISSFGTFAYGLTQVAQSVLSGELTFILKKKRLDKKIEKLKDHVILCGFGRNGRRALQKLQAYQQAVVVIENDQAIIDEFLIGKGIFYINGDATDDAVLQDAGIDKARALVSTLSKDADNLFVVISARALNPKLRLISRASKESTMRKLKAAGVNSVVMPEGVGGAHMASLVMNPDIVEFMERLSVDGSSSINLEEIKLSEITGNEESCSLADLHIRHKTGCTVIGIKDPDGNYTINPDSDHNLRANSRLFVLGRKEQIAQLGLLLNGPRKN